LNNTKKNLQALTLVSQEHTRVSWGVCLDLLVVHIYILIQTFFSKVDMNPDFKLQNLLSIKVFLGEIATTISSIG
jgi:hypothetical protein